MTNLNHPFSEGSLKSPLSTRTAQSLRMVYENMPRFSVAPDSSLSVIHSDTGLVIRSGNGESHGVMADAQIPSISKWTQMLEGDFLNRYFIARYNRYRRIWGSDGVAVTASDRDIVIEAGDGGGGVFLPYMEPVGAPESSRGWLARSVHHPLFHLAGLWSSMRARRPFELAKARRNYLLAGDVEDPDVGCIFTEDWDQEVQGLGKYALTQWSILQNNIDIIGTGGFDPLPGNGNYLDLSGTLLLNQFAGSIIRTTASITLKNQAYEFSYKIAGDNRGGGGNSTLTVSFHTASATYVLDTADPAAVYTHTVSGPYTGKITFECTDVDQIDKSKGPMILEVDVCAV
jgi:hypothetical protein